MAAAGEHARAASLATRFPPHVLREYALLADGERGALVGPRGDIAWMCAPRWDDDGVFSSLIGGAGTYAVTPADPRFVWGGHYEPGTLIWRSRWVTDRGIIECREALAFPGDGHRLVLLRRVEAVSGDACVQVLLDARAGFGREPMRSQRAEAGAWAARSGPLHLRWGGATDGRPDPHGSLQAEVVVPEGGHHDLVLEVSDRALPSTPVDAGHAWHTTVHAWSRAVPDIAGTLADEDARHSYAVLRGLTSASGGMVAFGEALLLFAAAGHRDRLDSAGWRAVEAAVDAIRACWRQRGAGVWEIDDRRWTHSRLICAAGLRAAGRLAPSAQGAEWDSLADRLVADAAQECVHASGRWQRSPGDERVDAALLLPAIRGAVPADDPRSRATLDAVRRELTVDGYVHRFQHGSHPLGEAEGAFLLCGFHLALGAHQQGDVVEAVRLFERNRSACGPPGLYSEEYDVQQRQLRGNLPQAFVHALLIECAQRLAEPGPQRS